jgi:hypothetical protein
MGVSGLFHASVFLTPKKYEYFRRRNSLGHIAGADELEKIKISCPRGSRATIRPSSRLYPSNYTDWAIRSHASVGRTKNHFTLFQDSVDPWQINTRNEVIVYVFK